ICTLSPGSPTTRLTYSVAGSDARRNTITSPRAGGSSVGKAQHIVAVVERRLHRPRRDQARKEHPRQPVKHGESEQDSRDVDLKRAAEAGAGAHIDDFREQRSAGRDSPSLGRPCPRPGSRSRAENPAADEPTAPQRLARLAPTLPLWQASRRF